MNGGDGNWWSNLSLPFQDKGVYYVEANVTVYNSQGQSCFSLNTTNTYNQFCMITFPDAKAETQYAHITTIFQITDPSLSVYLSVSVNNPYGENGGGGTESSLYCQTTTLTITRIA